MGFEWNNLTNKTASIYLSKIADEHLEACLSKNFIGSGQKFDDCVQWYRTIIYYLNNLAGLKGDISLSKSGNLLLMNMGDLGFFTFYLYLDVNLGLLALIDDFSFNQFKSLTIENKKTNFGILCESDEKDTIIIHRIINEEIRKFIAECEKVR